jgi:hypothetical protein
MDGPDQSHDTAKPELFGSSAVPGNSSSQWISGCPILRVFCEGWDPPAIYGKKAASRSADPTLRLTPDFLSIMATSTNCMRLSLKKAAHVAPTWFSAVGNPGQREGWGTRRSLTGRLFTGLPLPVDCLLVYLYRSTVYWSTFTGRLFTGLPLPVDCLLVYLYRSTVTRPTLYTVCRGTGGE